MAKKQVDPLKAKQKKQKILAAVLGVLFLGLLAFQVPRVMKRLHPSPPPTAVPSTTTTAAPPPGTPTLAAPTLQGAEQTATTPTDSTGSLASSTAPQVQDGQLASFSRFASKDPFSQQLSDTTPGSSGSTSTGSTSTGSTSTGSTPSGSGAVSGGGGSGTAPKPGSAVISVNGTLYTVPTGTDFPQASTTDASVVPLFHLVSLTAHTAKVSIAGGSYATGAAAITLKENRPVTLMNTADGTRYVLILKSLGTSVPTTKPATTTGTTTTVPVPPAAP
jgi:hypothetical protein